MIGYWLIPAEPQRSQLATVIRELAHRYDAAVFEPHVTLYSNDDTRDHAHRVIDKLATNHGPVSLSFSGIGYSQKFTETLFVQCVSGPEALRLSEAAKAASQSRHRYDFHPHLSLAYAHLDEETKARAAREIHIPFDRAFFDSIAAIEFPRLLESRADVEAWQTIVSAKLTG